MLIWPPSLPYAQFLGLIDTRVDARARSGEGAGYAKMRRRYTAVPRTHRVPIVLSGAQMQTFDSFYRTTLAEGTLPFDWEDPVTDEFVFFRFGGTRRPSASSRAARRAPGCGRACSSSSSCRAPPPGP